MSSFQPAPNPSIVHTQATRTPGRAHVLVIGNEKGGSGKSTTAMHIVVSLLGDGGRVATIDLDARQGTFSRYVENRGAYARRKGIELAMPMHAAVQASGDSADETAGWTSDGQRHWLRAEVRTADGTLQLLSNPIFFNWPVRP